MTDDAQSAKRALTTRAASGVSYALTMPAGKKARNPVSATSAHFRAVRVDETESKKSWTQKQSLLTSLFQQLEKEDSLITFQLLVDFLAQTTKKGKQLRRQSLTNQNVLLEQLAEFVETMLGVVDEGQSIYLVDNAAYLVEALKDEYVELTVFNVKMTDMFVQSMFSDRIWLETSRFASLRSLSRMRREIRKTPLKDPQKALDMVGILLGIKSP